MYIFLIKVFVCFKTAHVFGECTTVTVAPCSLESLYLEHTGLGALYMYLACSCTCPYYIVSVCRGFNRCYDWLAYSDSWASFFHNAQLGQLICACKNKAEPYYKRLVNLKRFEVFLGKYQTLVLIWNFPVKTSLSVNT